MKPGTVLLEEFPGGIAVVPHGPFLLEQLKYPPVYTGPESAFALGEVDYGKANWDPLPATATELKALQARGDYDFAVNQQGATKPVPAQRQAQDAISLRH